MKANSPQKSRKTKSKIKEKKRKEKRNKNEKKTSHGEQEDLEALEEYFKSIWRNKIGEEEDTEESEDRIDK